MLNLKFSKSNLLRFDTLKTVVSNSFFLKLTNQTKLGLNSSEEEKIPVLNHDTNQEIINNNPALGPVEKGKKKGGLTSHLVGDFNTNKKIPEGNIKEFQKSRAIASNNFISAVKAIEPAKKAKLKENDAQDIMKSYNEAIATLSIYL